MLSPIRSPITQGILQAINGVGDSIGRWDLSSLFDGGEAGTLWGPLPYYQDVAGVDEATWGDPVGLIPDASGNGTDFTQPTVTARPVLGRVPRSGRRNEWSSSEDLTVGVTTVNVTIAPDEETGAFRVTSTADTGHRQFYKLFPANRLTQFSLIVKAGSIGEVQLQWNGYGNSSFNLLTGVATGGTARMESLGDGWWRISTAGFNPAVHGQGWFLRLPDSAVTGDYVLVKHPQVEEPIGPESPPTPYQRIGATVYDITEANVPSVHYLHFDGTDDLVSTTLPAISNGTVVIAGTSGIWIDDDFNFDGGKFEIGPTSYTNGPDGVLPVIGDLIVGGTLVIDRQLTSDERAKVVRKMKSMGAPGVFELGPELVVNGGPNFSDTSGWYASGGADIFVLAGNLHAKNTILSWGRANMRVTSSLGPHVAKFSTRTVFGTGNSWSILGRPGGLEDYTVKTNRDNFITHTVVFDSVDTDITFGIQVNNTNVENEAAVEYYSLRKLELVP